MPLVLLGNRALRRVSKSISDPKAPAIKQILRSMEAQVREEEGVGLAAPQMGHNLRMFLMLATQPQQEEDLDISKLKYQEVINPEILEMSKETKKDFEGCLSIPGYVGVVERAKAITVQFTTSEGRQMRKTLRDFPARIFQHEFDHLNGVLYIDRMEPNSFIHNDEFGAMEWSDMEQLLRKTPASDK